jgi:hypothetical protein
MRSKSISLFVSFFFSSLFGYTQVNCRVLNNAFDIGESLSYEAEYHWGFINAIAGLATIDVLEGSMKHKNVFHYRAIGFTYPKYDWIYKVRDTVESFVDKTSLTPYRFQRNGSEGQKFVFENVIFNKVKAKAYTFISKHKKPLAIDTVAINECSFDVLSAIYYSRNVNFSYYKANDLIPVCLYLDNQHHNTYMRYLGKEEITTKHFGKYRCVKFKVNLVQGELFNAGENMTVWMTDDENQIPIYIETEILVGRLKVHLTNQKRLRNKINSLIISGKEN